MAAAIDDQRGAFLDTDADGSFSIRSRASRVTIGPISASSSMPFLIFSARARAASSGTILSPMSPTSTATLIAMQRSPAEP